MTASRQQCAEATVFLTLYKEAVETLKQSASNNIDWKNYLQFRDKFIGYREKYSTDSLKGLILSGDYQKKSKHVDKETWKNVEYMRFNQQNLYFIESYLFLKHLPEYQKFTGGPKELISILKKGNQSLKKQLDQTKSVQ